MAQDKNGKALQAGDDVLVRCKVESVDTDEEYSNVTLRTVEPIYPGEATSTIVLNAKQVEIVSPGFIGGQGDTTTSSGTKMQEEKTGSPV